MKGSEMDGGEGKRTSGKIEKGGGEEGERTRRGTKEGTEETANYTRTRINGLSYYFHYGYNEVLMARRSDKSEGLYGNGGRRGRGAAEKSEGERGAGGRRTADEGGRRWTD